jgi:hypothetical protein
MKILDFVSVTEVLRNNINIDKWPGQENFVNDLFSSYDESTPGGGGFGSAQVNKWLKGKEPIKTAILDHYGKEENQKQMTSAIKELILPLFTDPYMAAEELRSLLILSENVHPQKKEELLSEYSVQDKAGMAEFIMKVLCLGMELPFRKRNAKKKQLLPMGRRSTSVMGRIADTGIPNPCRHFLDREQELEELHSLLLDHRMVFVHGIPGIGKSELAKAYATRYGQEYTNVIYMNCSEDLKKMLVHLDFVDDLPSYSDEERFLWHNRFLRCLMEDTLLIVDNFNATVSEDAVLDEMLKYRCRIIFTTRSRYENHVSMELTELSRETLVELVSKFFPEAEEKQSEVGQIVDLLHQHTFAVELAARLLAKGKLEPNALLAKLKQQKAALDAADKLRTTKDGRNRKATYYDHIHSLFLLYDLPEAEQEIMRSLTLIPANGIDSRQFADWMKQQNMNAINDLVEMGFIHPKNDREIMLHPMICEVAVEELKPAVSTCEVLLDSLQGISLSHGRDFQDNRWVFQVIEHIQATIKKDDLPRYILFLQTAFEYMEKYLYESGMRAIIEELKSLLADDSVGTSADRAYLLDCSTVLETDINIQIALERTAIQVLGEVCADNAHLAANIFSNMGALYHFAGDKILAKVFMEKGIAVLEMYNLMGYHDSIRHLCNYAMVLTDLGEHRAAYSILEKLAAKVKNTHSDWCVDYADVHQSMGDVCYVMGAMEQAWNHNRIAMHIYEDVLTGEPLLLEEKRRGNLVGQLEEKHRGTPLDLLADGP